MVEEGEDEQVEQDGWGLVTTEGGVVLSVKTFCLPRHHNTRERALAFLLSFLSKGPTSTMYRRGLESILSRGGTRRGGRGRRVVVVVGN